MRDELIWFAQAMETKLRANDHKGRWENSTAEDVAWFMTHLKAEILELEEALLLGCPEDILGEAADVANYALMIADIAIRGKERT